MPDIALDIRMELLRLNPSLSFQQREDLIQRIPRCFQDIMADNAAHDAHDWRDFFDLSLLDDVAIVTVFRETEMEVWVFAADESIIQVAGRLAMIDVAEFLQAVRGHFALPEAGLRFPMARARPWLERLAKPG